MQKTKTAKILIVDDDLDLLDALKEGVDVPGYVLTVITASDGQRGLDLATKEQPDVVLVDYNMPHKDGFMMVDEIKRIEKLHNTKIIMLTAEDTKDKLWESIDREIDDFIGKPFDLLELEARVFHQLERRNSSS